MKPIACRALALLCAFAMNAIAQGPVVSVRPSSPTVNGTFTVDIAVTGAKDLFAYQFDLTFPAGSVAPTSITEGSFLPTAGTTYFIAGTPDSGNVRFVADALVGPLPGANGTGVLARATLSTNSSGPIPIGIANVILLDSNLATLLATTSGATVTGGPVVSPVTFTPGRLSFEYQIGQSAPAVQTVAMDSDRSFSFTADTGAPWLTVSPVIGTAPMNLSVGVNAAGLLAGAYVANVRLHAGGVGDFPLPVTLKVYDASQLITVQESLSFTAVAGGAVPPPQLLYVTASSRAVPFSAAASSSNGGNWLSAAPSGPNTPANVSVAVNSATLVPGVYTGAITLSSPGANGTKTIPVTLTISPPRPAFSSAGVANAASFAGGTIAPGEIVAIFGSAMGGTQLQTAIPISGQIGSVLAQTRVLFDGIPAPVLYTQNGNIGVVVPYAVAGQSSSQVQVEYQGVKSTAVSMPISAAAPGIFTFDSSGKGQAAALNDGTVNGVAHPAAPGSIVVLYGTGAGLMAPADSDGRLAAPPLGKPQLSVAVRIGDFDAEILYQGAAPGLVSGMLQVNARIPKEIKPSDTVPVSLIVGGIASQPAVTLSVR